MRNWRVLMWSLVPVWLLAAAAPAAPASPPEKVKLSLNFLPYGLHIGFFAARDLGWYREAGMDVEILKGEGSADAVRRMGTGVVDFAFADLGSLIVGRSDADTGRRGPPRSVQRRPQAVDEVEAFPREATVGVGGAAEMPVGGGARINRAVQLEMLANAARAQVHQVA